MAIQLYYDDSHLSEFEATVLSCVETDKGFRTVLDQTAFFPEGGGQRADNGVIGSVAVTDVQTEDGEVVHYLKAPLEPGRNYPCRIDWDVRFERMQNHSGEHIVSGIVHGLYGYDNVGFHMSEDVITIDFNGILEWDQLLEMERKSNEVIWKNVPIRAWFPTDEELASLDFRSKKELDEAVRLVRIEGVDLCACCAPHVNSTGEIGIIKILSVMKHRGGVRIEMIAGKTAYEKLRNDYEQVRAVSQMLSAKHNEITASVSRVSDETDELKQTIYELRMSILESRIEYYKDISRGNICEFNTGLADSMCRDLINALVEKTDGIVGVFTGDDSAGYRYILGSKQVNLREVIRDINSALSGKGGGSPTMVQGTMNCTKEQITNYFKA